MKYQRFKMEKFRSVNNRIQDLNRFYFAKTNQSIFNRRFQRYAKL